MDNPYVHGLRQHDSRPRSPVVVPHDMSALRKKILFENTLLEERVLHEFSASKGDGAGVDTGSAPLAPASAPAPAPSGIPTAGPLMRVNVNVGGNLVLLQLRALENAQGIYYTVTDGYWRIGAGEDNVPTDRLFFAGGVWQFISSNNFEPPYDQITNSTPNQSINYIPTSGWSPSITITAPAGIPVASTASVVIAGQNAIVPSGTYTKVTASGTRVAGSAGSDKLLLDTGVVYLKEAEAVVIDGVTLAYGQILVPPNTTFTSTYGAAVSPEPFWRAGVVRANYSEDDPYFYFAFLTISTNSSTDPTTIPTTGWSPSITITAA